MYASVSSELASQQLRKWKRGPYNSYTPEVGGEDVILTFPFFLTAIEMNILWDFDFAKITTYSILVQSWCVKRGEYVWNTVNLVSSALLIRKLGSFGFSYRSCQTSIMGKQRRANSHESRRKSHDLDSTTDDLLQQPQKRAARSIQKRIPCFFFLCHCVVISHIHDGFVECEPSPGLSFICFMLMFTHFSPGEHPFCLVVCTRGVAHMMANKVCCSCIDAAKFCDGFVGTWAVCYFIFLSLLYLFPDGSSEENFVGYLMLSLSSLSSPRSIS